MRKNLRKPAPLLLAALCAGSMLLCACNKTEETTETTIWEAPTAVETTTEAPIETTIRNAKDHTHYEKVTLDGVKENYFVSTDYCYLESEKYVLLIDKDIKIPGDFAVVLDAVIDEIEKQTGLSAVPENREYPNICESSGYYNGFNPWKDWNVGSKIPIFLVCDREPKGWISCATSDDVVIVSYDMISDEVWNSVPAYRDNPWRRDGYLDYTEIIHELTHTVTQRNVPMSKIMTEGIAEYMSVSVLNALADKYPSLAEVKAKKNSDDNYVPEKVNSSNAEAIFVSDYKDVSHADRGAEYTFGKYLFMYLNEQSGDEFFKNIADKLIASGINYHYDEYDEASMQKIAGIFKELYGDDVFEKFGEWCVKNNHLQKYEKQTPSFLRAFLTHIPQDPFYLFGLLGEWIKIGHFGRS